MHVRGALLNFKKKGYILTCAAQAERDDTGLDAKMQIYAHNTMAYVAQIHDIQPRETLKFSTILTT